jgi:hypothetical protein
MSERVQFSDFVRVALGAVFVLVAAGVILDIRRLHVSAAGNDQVSYIAVARNWLETGTRRNNVIYPSQLSAAASKDYFYMPGFYFALHASFAVFGVGEFQAQVPSLVSFVIAAMAIFGIGAGLYGRRAGYVSAGAFVLTPTHVIYACSAMAELTVAASVAVSFCAFIWLPQRWRVICGPVLLVPPFLCRETTSFLAFGMALMLCGRSSGERLAKRAGFLLASAAMLGAVFTSPISRGRPSLLKANVLDGSYGAIYNDAVRMEGVDASAADWTLAMVRNALENVFAGYLAAALSRPVSVEVWTVTAVIAITIWCIVHGHKRRRKDPFPLAAGVFALAILVFLVFCYKLMDKCGVRLLMAASPLLDVFLGRRVETWTRGEKLGSLHDFVQVRKLAAVAACLLIGVLWIQRVRYRLVDAYDRECIEFLESLGHDDCRVLVCPSSYSFPYVLRHHPVRWSFMPANRHTLELLDGRHPLGTIVYQCDDPMTDLTRDDIESLGWSLERTAQFSTKSFLIFKRAQFVANDRAAAER